MATMNISLPDEMKAWVEKQAEGGRYANVSDFMRDVIRKEQERGSVIAEIAAALEEGEASGFRPYSRAELEAELGLTEGKDAA